MNGYPKMKLLRSRTTKSRSMDFADLLYNSIPQTQNPTFKIKTPCPTKPTTTAHDSVSDPDHDDGVLVHDGRKKGSSGRNSCGGVLRRNSSVTSASSSLQAAMKRAFSMRRSSSVSERYCRIHDQSATACFLQSPPNDVDVDEEGMDIAGAMQPAGSMDKKMKMKQHKNGKIFKACKRLLGL